MLPLGALKLFVPVKFSSTITLRNLVFSTLLISELLNLSTSDRWRFFLWPSYDHELSFSRIGAKFFALFHSTRLEGS